MQCQKYTGKEMEVGLHASALIKTCEWGLGKITFFFLPLLFKSQNKTPNMKSIVIVFYSVPSLQSLEVNKRAIGENLSRVKYH